MSLQQNICQNERLISQLLLEDEDLRDIVEEFVGALENRLAELETAHAKQDWDQMVMLAHRLKGAAGSYGYPDMSQVCATMEDQFRDQQAENFETWMKQLHGMTIAAQEGLTSMPS